MSRDFKFRVWNGTEIIHDVTVGRFGAFYVNPGAKGDGLDPRDSASLTPFNTIYTDQTPVMQYTGLKDKNGVEVYEGDIITHSHDGMIGEICWSEGLYVFVIEKDDEIIADLSEYNYEPEVIGNIYENPDLLKKGIQ